MIELKSPLIGEGYITHVTGTKGAGKTTLIGDMLYTEMEKGPCAYLFTRREGNQHGGGWTVLPRKVREGCRLIFLENLGDLDTLFKEWRKKRIQALGVDTSTGVELLIRSKVTGDDLLDLRTKTGDNQYKRFDNMLAYYLQSFRDVAKYTMMVSPAIPTSYNPEKATTDTGMSGTSIDADKRFGPESETNKSKQKLLYLSDYCFHINQEEHPASGKIKSRVLMMQPSLKLMTASRVTLGKSMNNITLEPEWGVNWVKVKGEIEGAID